MLKRAKSIIGSLSLPGDKSLTHRAFILAALSEGQSTIFNPLLSEDTRSTQSCLEKLGVRFSAFEMGLAENHLQLEPRGSILEDRRLGFLSPINRRSLYGVQVDPRGAFGSEVAQGQVLDCGNSGTTMRLLSGVIAGKGIYATLTGDDSLQRRPMDRIRIPLQKMGAEIEGDRPPLYFKGGTLAGIEFSSPVASAQVKGAVLLASLFANGETCYREKYPTRDHTERILAVLGIQIKIEPSGSGTEYRLRGGQCLRSFQFTIPGDLSSAFYWICAATLIPHSRLVLQNVGLNPTRTACLDLLRSSGAEITVENRSEELSEPRGDLTVCYADALKPFTVMPSQVPNLIDELPMLMLMATQIEGTSCFKGLEELRFKESNRLTSMVSGLKTMGAKIRESRNDVIIFGPTPLKGARIDLEKDHRVVMAFSIGALIAEGRTEISNPELVDVSYPLFFEDMEKICVF